MNEDLGKSYYVRLNFKELFYIFFKKKQCPICKNKITSEMKKEYVGIKKVHIPSGGGWNSENYKLTRCYFCDNCNKLYEISELIK